MSAKINLADMVQAVETIRRCNLAQLKIIQDETGKRLDTIAALKLAKDEKRMNAEDTA